MTSQFLFKFCIFFIVTKHNSSVNFKVLPFLFWTKGSHQSPNFDTSKCSGEMLPYSSCHFSNHKSVFFCLAQTIYTLVTRSQLKHKFFRLLSAQVKIYEVPHVNFKTTSQFLFKFCVILHCHDAKLLCEF